MDTATYHNLRKMSNREAQMLAADLKASGWLYVKVSPPHVGREHLTSGWSVVAQEGRGKIRGFVSRAHFDAYVNGGVEAWKAALAQEK